MEVNTENIRDASLQQSASKETTGVFHEQDSAVSVDVCVVKQEAERVCPEAAYFHRELGVVELTEFEGARLAGLEADLVLTLLACEVLGLRKLGALRPGLRVLDEGFNDLLAVLRLLLQLGDLFVG